jgi:hypothetical protein
MVGEHHGSENGEIHNHKHSRHAGIRALRRRLGTIRQLATEEVRKSEGID